MTERGEIEVLLPLQRLPDEAETRELLNIALREARQLVAPVQGRVLALTSVARAETLEGQLALKVRFLVSAPESCWAAGRIFSIPAALGSAN